MSTQIDNPSFYAEPKQKVFGMKTRAMLHLAAQVAGTSFRRLARESYVRSVDRLVHFSRHLRRR